MDIASARRILVLACAGLAAAACSSASPGSAPAPAPTSQPATAASPTAAAPTTAAPTGAAPAGTETPPPGDIPDTTVYVPYRPASGQYEVKVPEGWARTVSTAAVSFTDKLNTVTIQAVRAAAPTPASARSSE